MVAMSMRLNHFMPDKIQQPVKLRAVLPHEWIFGAYLLLTGLRLLAHGGPARNWSLVFLGCWLAGILIFFWAERNPAAWRWRVRLLFYPAAMGVSFYAMGVAVPLLGHPKVDRSEERRVGKECRPGRPAHRQ